MLLPPDSYPRVLEADFWETDWQDLGLHECPLQLVVANTAPYLSTSVSGSPRPP